MDLRVASLFHVDPQNHLRPPVDPLPDEPAVLPELKLERRRVSELIRRVGWSLNETRTRTVCVLYHFHGDSARDPGLWTRQTGLSTLCLLCQHQQNPDGLPLHAGIRQQLRCPEFLLTPEPEKQVCFGRRCLNPRRFHVVNRATGPDPVPHTSSSSH